MRPRPLNPFLLLSLILVTHLVGVSLAHENQLSGLLYMQPQEPIPQEPFTITFELYDPEGKFIPEAILNLSIPDLELQQSFTETSQTGIYETTLSLPEGKWFSDLTEATFENESNTVQFGLKVGEKNLDTIEILFPVIETQNRQRFWIIISSNLLAIIGLAIYIKYFSHKQNHNLGSIGSLSKANTANTHS